jgi:D-tyrosyl-tRNA(Tyr) deacylase
MDFIMKAVLQRVSEASVSIDGNITGSIKKGFLVLLGIGENDDKVIVRKMAEKIQKLRIFQDENGKTNLSSADIGGELLVVSQFTLYADCRKGNRPSFENAAKPQLAEELYNYFIEYSQDKFKKTAAGVFGGDMKVSLINDGPFTVILEI